MSGIKKIYNKVDWEKVDECLPMSQDPAVREKRKALFKKIDASGNGHLTLTEVQGGITSLFEKGQLPITDLKPAINCAFALARNLDPTIHGARNRNNSRRGGTDTNVDATEFHALLCAFRQYLELQVLFVSIDKDGDAYLHLEEAKPAFALLETWGLSASEVKAKFPDKWTETLNFEQFAEWCIQHTFKGGMNLKLDNDDNEDVRIRGAAAAIKKDVEMKEGTNYGASLEEAQNKTKVREAFNKYDTDKNGKISLDELTVVLQALCQMTDEECKTLFAALDKNHDDTLDYEEFFDWIFESHKAAKENLKK